MSGALDQTYMTCIYRSLAVGTAKASFTTEIAINDTTGMGAQFYLPSNYFVPPQTGSRLKVVARGILSCTGTPTYTFTLRGGAAASITSGIWLGSAALTCASGITNKGWEFEGDVTVRTNAAAGANSTLFGGGMISCPAGLASPFQYELWGGAAQPGTIATLDTSIANFLNFNVACSASSPSNSIQLLGLEVWSIRD